MKNIAISTIDWLNLDDFDTADDFAFCVTQADLDEKHQVTRRTSY